MPGNYVTTNLVVDYRAALALSGTTPPVVYPMTTTWTNKTGGAANNGTLTGIISDPNGGWKGLEEVGMTNPYRLAFDGADDIVLSGYTMVSTKTLSIEFFGRIMGPGYDAGNGWYAFTGTNASAAGQWLNGLVYSPSTKQIGFFTNVYGAGGVPLTMGGPKIEYGEYFHVVLVWLPSKTGIKIYINGTLVVTGSQTHVTGTNTQKFQLGGYGVTGVGYGRAKMECISARIYEKELTAAEVLQNYNDAGLVAGRYLVKDGSNYYGASIGPLHEVNIAKLGVASATNSYSGLTPEFAIDGDPATVWNGQGSGLTWSLAMTQVYTFSKVNVTWAGNNYGIVEYSIDNINWNAVGPYGAVGADIFTADKKPFKARYFRIVISGYDWSNIYEFQAICYDFEIGVPVTLPISDNTFTEKGIQKLTDVISSLPLYSNPEIIYNEKVQERYTEDITPLMTGPIHPDMEVESSSFYDANYVPWRVFDKGLTGIDCWASASGTPMGWLSIGFKIQRKVTHYEIFHRQITADPGSAPKNWTFEGRNSTTDNWVVIDTQINQTAWITNQRRRFTVATPGKYRYYRMNISANNGQVYVAIGELKLYEGRDMPTLNMQALPKGKIVKGITDVDLASVDVVRQLSFIGTGGGAAKANFIFSKDKGSTWNTLKFAWDGVSYTDDLVPDMTSDTTPAPTKVWLNSGYGGQAAFYAFDNDTTTLERYAQLYTPSAVFIDFGPGNAYPVSRYTMIAGYPPVPGPYDPRSWDFEGSDDGVNWNILHQVKNQPDFLEKRFTYTFENDRSFRYYRFAVYTADSGIPAIYDITLHMKVYTDITIEPINIANESEVAAKSTPIWMMQFLTPAITNALFGNRDYIRFSYYLDQSDYVNIASIDALVALFDMKGIWNGAIIGTDYNVDIFNTAVKFILTSNGGFKLNY